MTLPKKIGTMPVFFYTHQLGKERMKITETIRAEIRKLVESAKNIRISYSANGGITTQTLSGKGAIEKIETLLKEAKVTRVKIVTPKKKVIADFPLAGAATGAAVLFVFSLALGALTAALMILSGCDIEIEAEEKK